MKHLNFIEGLLQDHLLRLYDVVTSVRRKPSLETVFVVNIIALLDKLKENERQAAPARRSQMPRALQNVQDHSPSGTIHAIDPGTKPELEGALTGHSLAGRSPQPITYEQETSEPADQWLSYPSGATEALDGSHHKLAELTPELFTAFGNPNERLPDRLATLTESSNAKQTRLGEGY